MCTQISSCAAYHVYVSARLTHPLTVHVIISRRVTLGEMLVTNARVMCLDEVSTGLDAAVTYHIFAALRAWTRITQGSIVTALLQPTPETYALFDDVILMREGVIVYHGARQHVAAWFQQHVGLVDASSCACITACRQMCYRAFVRQGDRHPSLMCLSVHVLCIIPSLQCADPFRRG